MKTLMQCQTTKQAEIDGSNNNLDYVFLVNSDTNKFSLDIKESDWGHNESILNSLVGNLVKFSKSGIIEPYLAEHFSISADRLTWTYTLRPNITCEDGTVITADSFVSAIHRQLKMYSEETTPIDLENLSGYESFHLKKTDKINGIKTKNNSIVFEFIKPPQDLNELLRMPYFGFWCPQNYSDNGWKQTGKFISSGPYKLSKDSSPDKIIVEKRMDWFSVVADSPQKVSFFYATPSNFETKSKLSNAFIVETSLDINFNETIFKNLSKINAPPTWISTFVLSPFEKSPFSNIQFRRYFLNKLRKNQINTAFNSTYFYPNARSEVQENYENYKPQKEIKISVGYFGKSKTKNIQEIEHLLKTTFEKDGLSFEFIGKPASEDDWMKKLFSNNEVDIRISSVAAGSNIRNFIIKMMFCTKLGVSFPDPSGRICNLVSKQDSEPEKITFDYVKEFNQALYDDASVIPLEHFGTTWILSDLIDRDSFPPTVDTPLFESLRFK